MIDKEIKIPFYAKATIFLIGIIALFAVLYIAQDIIVPLVFAIIIAILLHPVVNFFVRKKINRVIAIILTLILTFLVIALFGFLLGTQISRFGESWPQLVDKITLNVNQTITDAASYFDTNPQIIRDWIAKTKDELLNFSNAAIGQTIISIGGMVMTLLLIPVYTFIILFYHPLLIEFIHRVFVSSDQKQVSSIVSRTKNVVQSYLIGLVIEGVLVAAMNSAGLLILGIEYAILIGIIGAVLNVIPYVGGIVAVAIPMMVAIATKSSAWYAFYVLAIYYFIQLIDNNFIVPFIVSSKVRINALFSIIAVLVGYALWGIPGMFLSIPLLAIIKVIFDHIESLKPWGFLLGDTMPPIIKLKQLKIKIPKKIFL